MKKILTSLVVGAILATVANADLSRIEMGAGSWLNTPSGGGVTSSDSDRLLRLDGEYQSDESASGEFYFWMLIKQPVPVVPNIRLEYTTIEDQGKTTGTHDGDSYDNEDTDIRIRQYDLVGYYNLLDNTAWTTLDLGLDLKVISSRANIDSKDYTYKDSMVIPLLYARTRVDVPATNIGFEADVKYITDGDSTMYDIRAKVDYSFDFAMTRPALELGYRMQKFDIDDHGTKMDLDYGGIYAGMMLRF